MLDISKRSIIRFVDQGKELELFIAKYKEGLLKRLQIGCGMIALQQEDTKGVCEATEKAVAIIQARGEVVLQQNKQWRKEEEGGLEITFGDKNQQRLRDGMDVDVESKDTGRIGDQFSGPHTNTEGTMVLLTDMGKTCQ